MKKIILLTTAMFFCASYIIAQDEATTADYGVSVGFSPFGLSVSLAHNISAQTSVYVTAGGFPTADAPFSPTIDGFGDYDLVSGSSWMGFFLNHRPFEDSDWFRINTGIGIGNIENTLTDASGAEYTANYKENPVAYLGVGFGQRPVEGFTFGLDVGLLFGAGPVIAGPDPAKVDAIGESPFFGNILPNFQLSVGYGF